MIKIEEKKLTSSRKFNRKFFKFIDREFEDNRYLHDNEEDMTSPFLIIEKDELKNIIVQYCNENDNLNEELVNELKAHVK